jgi:uncharacterized Zn-finger protein
MLNNVFISRIFCPMLLVAIAMVVWNSGWSRKVTVLARIFCSTGHPMSVRELKAHWPYLGRQGHREVFSTIIIKVTPVAMVTTQVKPRGPFYACKHARTHPRVFVDISGRNSGQDGGCYHASDSVTYQASCQATTWGTVARPYANYLTNRPENNFPC